MFALDGDLLIVGQNASFDHAIVNGTIGLNNATINGNLTFVGSQITDSEGLALSAELLCVSGDLFCHAGFVAHGAVDLAGASIKGTLDVSKANLTNPYQGRTEDPNDGTALRGDLLTVGQRVWGSGLVAAGEVNLMDATISGGVFLENARLVNPARQALIAERVTIHGDAYLADGFSTEGAVNLTSGTIKGSLVLSGAVLRNEKPDAASDGTTFGVALMASLLTVDQLLVAVGLSVDGQIDLTSARVSRGIVFSGATLRNPRGNALNAERLIVEGDMVLDRRCSAVGVVNLTSSSIRGKLDVSGASLHVAGDDPEPDQMSSASALLARWITVDKGLIADEATIEGMDIFRSKRDGRYRSLQRHAARPR